MSALFDTSAVIALMDPSEIFHEWSLREFTARQAEGPIIISDVIYAEISAGLDTQEAVDTVIQSFAFERCPRDDRSLFLAGQRFKKYKKTDGTKVNVLPDFFIGADATILNVPIITTNPRDFRGFFSGLRIISPDGEEIVP